jgi:hypothetical protein
VVFDAMHQIQGGMACVVAQHVSAHSGLGHVGGMFDRTRMGSVGGDAAACREHKGLER